MLDGFSTFRTNPNKEKNTIDLESPAEKYIHENTGNFESSFNSTDLVNNKKKFSIITNEVDVSLLFYL